MKLERVNEIMKLAAEPRLRLDAYQSRGSEQRATGTLLPEVPVVSNFTTDWPALSDAEKGRAQSEFNPESKPRRPKRSRKK